MNVKLQAYLDLKARIKEKCPRLGQYVRLFNNQFTYLEEQEQIVFPFPCVFIEFLGDIVWTQLGAGAQIANSPLAFRFHIGSNYYNGPDQEENLEVLELVEELHDALQYFTSGIFNNMIRYAERQDTQHTSVYVWQVDYYTTLTDMSQNRPVDAIETTGDVVHVLEVTMKKTWG